MRQPSPRSAGIALILLTASGCYHYRVAPRGTTFGQAVQAPGHVAHNIAWGLITIPDRVDGDGLCVSGRLSEVRVHSNVGFALLTILTLGFWSPVTLEPTCATDQPTVLPSPTDSSGNEQTVSPQGSAR